MSTASWKIRRLHIETSTLCNADCEICPQALIRRARKIDVDRVRRLISEDALPYVETIHLVEFHNYNEPFLMFDLFCDLTDFTNRTLGPGKVGVVSNGSIMSQEKADRLLDLGLCHVLFSVDGFSKVVYEEHRKGLDRDEVYDNIDTFIRRSGEKNGPTPLINYVVTPRNAHEADIAREHFQSRRCSFHLSGCDGRGSDVGKIPAIRDMGGISPCDYALDGVYVLSNLDVVPCCEDWSGKDVMGNLGEKTLQEIVDGPAYQRFRDLHFSGRRRESVLCKDCKTNMSYGESYLKTVPRDDLVQIQIGVR